MSKKQKDKVKSEYKYKRGEQALLAKREKRLEKMYRRKLKLGIDTKCDRMDALFTPHLTSLDDPNSVQVQTSQEFVNDAVLLEKSRKSMPLAFEKVTTAISLLIKENPKGVMKAFGEKYRALNPLISNVYYENFSQQRKKEVLKKYVYHLSKYGIGYWREYIKKTYRLKHVEEFDENTGKVKKGLKWVYDVFDVVGENIHPRNVLLDNNCISVKDINKPANDCGILEYLTKGEFDSKYPPEIYENSEFVQENQPWLVNVNHNQTDGDDNVDEKTKIQVVEYENRYENLLETWAGKIPIKSVPLPGDELSLNGDKWVEDLDNYDAIGICQLIEIYLPIVDDIVNSSLERLRQLVRPNEDWFNGVDLQDEADDVVYGSGAVRKFTGQKDDIVYSKPPSRTAAEAQEKEEVMLEIDTVTMTPRNLSGTDTAKTAYQAAQNRESALQKFTLPLGNIKKTIEDAANLDLPLYAIAYSEPLETKILKKGDDEFDEGMAIFQQSRELGLDDERVVVMKKGDDGQPTQISRRKFREMELPIKVEAEEEDEEGENKPTGRIIEADERGFWELLPEQFNWKGRMEIIGTSFLPTSKVLDDEQQKEMIEFMMNIPITDEFGNPVLTDASGKPYMIDKVRLAKDRIRLNRNFDPDRYVVPTTAQNQQQGDLENDNPLNSKTNLNADNKVNKSRPEAGNLPA